MTMSNEDFKEAVEKAVEKAQAVPFEVEPGGNSTGLIEQIEQAENEPDPESYVEIERVKED